MAALRTRPAAPLAILPKGGWVLTTLEVWSRLWISVEIGRRNFRNLKRVLLDTLQRGRVEHRFLFTTDGFERYEWAAKRLLLGICIYCQHLPEEAPKFFVTFESSSEGARQ